MAAWAACHYMAVWLMCHMLCNRKWKAIFSSVYKKYIYFVTSVSRNACFWMESVLIVTVWELTGSDRDSASGTADAWMCKCLRAAVRGRCEDRMEKKQTWGPREGLTSAVMRVIAWPTHSLSLCPCVCVCLCDQTPAPQLAPPLHAQQPNCSWQPLAH